MKHIEFIIKTADTLIMVLTRETLRLAQERDAAVKARDELLEKVGVLESQLRREEAKDPEWGAESALLTRAQFVKQLTEELSKCGCELRSATLGRYKACYSWIVVVSYRKVLHDQQVVLPADMRDPYCTEALRMVTSTVFTTAKEASERVTGPGPAIYNRASFKERLASRLNNPEREIIDVSLSANVNERYVWVVVVRTKGVLGEIREIRVEIPNDVPVYGEEAFDFVLRRVVERTRGRVIRARARKASDTCR